MANIIETQKQGLISTLISHLMKIIANYGLFVATFLIMFFTLVYFSKQAYSIKNYFLLQLSFLILGILYTIGFFKTVNWAKRYFGFTEMVWTTAVALTGLTVINYSSSIWLMQTLPISYACGSLLFILPFLFMIAFEFLTIVPHKIYTYWQYPYGMEVPVIEVMNPKKIKFNISKRPKDITYAEFELNVPTNYLLGDFLHYFIHRYNYDKNPTDPILISEDNSKENLFNWQIFKMHKLFGKQVLDPDKSFDELKLKNGDSIFITRM